MGHVSFSRGACGRGRMSVPLRVGDVDWFQRAGDSRGGKRETECSALEQLGLRGAWAGQRWAGSAGGRTCARRLCTSDGNTRGPGATAIASCRLFFRQISGSISLFVWRYCLRSQATAVVRFTCRSLSALYKEESEGHVCSWSGKNQGVRETLTNTDIFCASKKKRHSSVYGGKQGRW